MVSLNVVSVTFPHFSYSMLTTNGNVSQFHAGKTFLLHNFYVPAHTFFYVQESATSCDFYRRRQVDVFVLKTVERNSMRRASRQVCCLWDCT